MDDFDIYFKDIFREFKQRQTTELTFRSYLKKLIEKTFPELKLSEENKQIRKIGRPDFTCFKKNGIKVGYIETKDIGIDLDKELGGEQIKKYSEGAIPNIILTDYMRFILCKNQEPVLDVQLFDISDLKKGNAFINNDKIRKFKQLIETFFGYNLPTIKNATELAIELSKRAKLLRELGKEQLEEDIKNPNSQEKSSIYDFYEAFRELIKEADIGECIDAYSQTITYGLFLARIGSKNGLSRDSAVSYIPSSIKIIKKIFSNIIGDSLPSNLSWIIDEIIDILNSADIDKILSEFVFEGKNYKDPFIHFYEDFLKEYDPEKRKHLGVYYTPEPVVSFITKSINKILKRDFGKSKGFADDSVKSLDFATGTGTFLANSFVLALKEIRESGLSGIEKEKIKNHLLKDFYGFEILVSPYVIAHLKLEVLLKEEGYTLENNERVQVYLTNTLNDPNETINTLIGFMKELSYETMIANLVKKEKPILVVMGNPPYSGMSANKGEWINNILKKGYTKPNGTKDEGYYFIDGKPLGERNPKWLQNDYVKFIRFAQWKIDKSGEGIVGIITSHSYLDNPTFRGMRQSLMKSFNTIYILNLHGNSRKKEKSPDGTKLSATCQKIIRQA
jgi:type I restriction-modification system DNA methylase subunit